MPWKLLNHHSRSQLCYTRFEHSAQIKIHCLAIIMQGWKVEREPVIPAVPLKCNFLFTEVKLFMSTL